MKHFYLYLSVFLISSACTKVEVNQYEVDPVEVSDDHAEKSRRKSDLQLMSIMYSDVFGQSITQSELQTLSNTYNSFGDKQVIIDRLTWRFLNDVQADLPSQSEWTANPEGLVNTLFQRYLSRYPDEMERWYYVNWMSDNPDLEVKHLAYVLLTSDEYRYY
ncbi:MAG: hypothetical protein EP346_01825 [Bacteroidetes bacterium]|nr:MAG: hypothetical protein EP346_01825 [Bacteroidota bacterium]